MKVSSPLGRAVHHGGHFVGSIKAPERQNHPEPPNIGKKLWGGEWAEKLEDNPWDTDFLI